MCQIPIKMLKKHAIPNSGLRSLKIYSAKEHRITSQSLVLYLAITTILELRYHFILWIFALPVEYFYCWYCWHWRVLPRCYKINDAKTFKSLRNGVLFVLAWVACVACLRGWCASVCGVGSALAWVTC